MTAAVPPVRFSVVIPAYNEQDGLAATLDSLRAQDFPGTYEVIVVDNGSDDATAARAAQGGATVIAEPRLGVCRARQTGTMAARGEIVVSTDADTVHPPGWLSRIDHVFRDHPAVVAVGGPCRYADPPWWARLFPPLGFAMVAGLHTITGRVCYLTATNVAFRRDGFAGYDTTLSQGGDEIDLLRRLGRQGRVWWCADNAVTTSSRRLDQGLAYTLVVSYGYHYALAYVLNRATSRPLLGAAPAIRATDAVDVRRRRRRWRRVVLAAAAATAILRYLRRS